MNESVATLLPTGVTQPKLNRVRQFLTSKDKTGQTGLARAEKKVWFKRLPEAVQNNNGITYYKGNSYLRVWI